MERPTDGELLADVASSSSRASFEELLRRHATLVYGECRRLLADVHDAEDAAQAVFFVLWMKATSLRRRATVAGWLHRVASNVCRNAQRARNVRRIHERRAAEMKLQSSSGNPSGGVEMRDVLDLELERLPEKYRLPLLLFHLEGRSIEEIAALMNVNSSTIGTRLSRGRDLLRDRMLRRGIAMTAAASTAAISDAAMAAALPPAFAAATARSAGLFAAGQLGAGGVVSPQAAALAKGAIRMLTVAKIKLAITGVAVLALVGGGTVALVAVAGASAKPPESKRNASEPTVAGPRAAPAKIVALEARPAKTAAADVTLAFAGTVVDDRGKPVAGAKITLHKLALNYWRSSLPPSGASTLAVSNAQGRFEFSSPQGDLSVRGAAFAPKLIAMKEGYGFASAVSFDFETTGRLRAKFLDGPERVVALEKGPNVLKLTSDDVPVHGRIVDAKGQPVSGANVETVGVWAGTGGTLDAWEATAKEPGTDVQQLRRHSFPMIFGPRPTVVPTVRTDAAGWFTLKGLGRERIAHVVISGPGIETTELEVRSRRGSVVKVPLVAESDDPPRRARLGPRLENTFYPSEFTFIAAPSVPAEGSVTDSKTKRPLGGIVVRADRTAAADPLAGSRAAPYIWTTTDRDGHYRLEGLPLGQSTVGLWPPVGSRYLAGLVEVTTRIGAKPSATDIQLAAGTLVRGRVTDGRTHLPQRGILEYFAFETNPYLKDAASFAQRSGGPPMPVQNQGDGPRRRARPRPGGPPITVQNQGDPDNSFRSDENGVFEIPVLPGKGILAFRALSTVFPVGAGADKIDGPKREQFGRTFFNTVPFACPAEGFHLLTPLDPEPGTESLTLNLTLDSGASVKGHVLDAAGHPLDDYYILGANKLPRWSRQAEATFVVKGYFPNEHRRLFFYHPGKNLVGTYELAGQPSGELAIKLQPGATIAGRVVDTDGKPLADVVIIDASPLGSPDMSGLLRRPPGAGGFRMNAPANREADPRQGALPTFLADRRVATDKQGRFEIPGIIPGLKYSAMVRGFVEGQGRVNGPIFTNETAGPGETKQLGDLRLVPRDFSRRTRPRGPEPGLDGPRPSTR